MLTWPKERWYETFLTAKFTERATYQDVTLVAWPYKSKFEHENCIWIWNRNGRRWTTKTIGQREREKYHTTKWNKIPREFNIYSVRQQHKLGRRELELNQNQFRHCCQGKYEQEINFFFSPNGMLVHVQTQSWLGRTLPSSDEKRINEG